MPNQLIISNSGAVVVVDNPLAFSPNLSIPHGQVGVAFPSGVSIGTVSGGVGPYTFSNVTGMPAGLSLTASGVITGTPTAAGQSNPGFTITDSSP